MAKDFSQEEWDELLARYPRGMAVFGTVRSHERYGVWVTLDDLPEVPALLENIHFEIVEKTPGHRIRFPDDYPPVGSAIQTRILAWSLRPKDVRLTQSSHLEWIYDRSLASR